MKKHTSRNPNFVSYVKSKIEKNYFSNHIGLTFDKIEEGYIEASAPFETFIQQQDGYVHGGFTSALCDIVCGFAGYTLVEEQQRVMTVEIKVSYFNRGIGQKIIGKGSVVKAGKQFFFCEGEVYAINNGEEILMAKATSTMAVIHKK
jgi:uncharacterized protein (TIGR00369 family)